MTSQPRLFLLQRYWGPPSSRLNVPREQQTRPHSLPRLRLLFVPVRYQTWKSTACSSCITPAVPPAQTLAWHAPARNKGSISPSQKAKLSSWRLPTSHERYFSGLSGIRVAPSLGVLHAASMTLPANHNIVESSEMGGCS